MKTNVITSISLKEIAGVPSVVWNGIDLHSRKSMDYCWEEPVIERSHTLESPVPPEGPEGYARLPNIMIPDIYSVQALLSACECFDRPPISSWAMARQINERDIPVSDSVDPEALLNAIGVKRRTSTILRRTAEAIDRWCYRSSVSTAIPVKDIAGMAQDMKALVTMLLYSIGDACTPEMLARNTPDSLAMFDSECECYRSYVQDIPSWMLPEGVDGLTDDYENHLLPLIRLVAQAEGPDPAAQEELRMYCSRLISALMYPLAPVLTSEGFYVGGEYASLGGAYAFWAHEAIYGKAAVCKYCGKLFLRKRKSGEFCGGPCRQGWHDSHKQ